MTGSAAMAEDSKENKENTPAPAVQSFITSFRYNFGFQLIARLFSFGLNFYLLRAVDGDVMGIANVRLTLLYSTVLFVVREPFRKACISSHGEDTDDVPCCEYGEDEEEEDTLERRASRSSLMNTLWLCPLSSSLLAILLSLVWQHLLSTPQQHEYEYPLAVWTFALCAVVESVAEPLWIIAQRLKLFKFIVRSTCC